LAIKKKPRHLYRKNFDKNIFFCYIFIYNLFQIKTYLKPPKENIMKKLLILTAAILLFAQTTLVQGFVGLDKFNDNSIDLNKWNTINTGGTTELREAQTVLQFRDIVGADESWTVLGWKKLFPKDQSWKVMVDISIPFGLLNPFSGNYEDISLFIGLRNVNDPNDSVSLDYYHSTSNNTEIASFNAYKQTDGIELIDYAVPTTTNYASLMLEWSHIGNFFSLSYDVDSGQDSFTHLMNIPVADWNMGTGNPFELGIGFGNEGNNVTVDWDDNVFMNNYKAVPEPGAVFLFASGFIFFIRKFKKN